MSGFLSTFVTPAIIPAPSVILHRLGTPLLAAALLLVAWTSSVLAHPGSVAFWHVVVQGGDVHSRIIVSVEDAVWPAGARANTEELDGAALDALAVHLVPHFTASVDGEPVPATVQSVRAISNDNIEIVVLHRTRRPDGALTLQSTFHAITDDDHRVIARLERDGESTPFVLHAAAPRHDVAAPGAGRTHTTTFAAMVVLGIAHILTGYDHLVFLACLLLPGGSWRSRALIVTAFTVAHSLTLGLAAMQVITLPERFVEAAIAVSIAYVALQNLLGGREAQRWPAAFGFGLVHGFGFAGMLDLLHLPTSLWVTSLFAFNIGVEVGQMAVVAIAVPVLAFVARHSWQPRAVQFTSAGVFALAVFWIVERLS